MPGPTVTSSASTSYLDSVAATDPARTYKQDLLNALLIEHGDYVLDVGCGPATDLTSLAIAVGPTGRVIGVDQDPVMVETARTRTAANPIINLLQADAHQLPLDSGSIDRARVDRVLMHVADPAAVLGEIHRVLRAGRLLTLAEPDWDTLAIDHPDLDTTRAFTRYIAHEVNRNQAIGRQLPRLAAHAGFTAREVHNAAVVLDDFDTAETILGLRRNTGRAVTAGYLTPEAGRAWIDYLTSTDAFFATVSFVTVLAQARPR